MRYVEEGDSVMGKRLYYEGRKVNPKGVFRKSGTHRGQRGTIYDGECWIESAIKISKNKKQKK